MRLLPGAEPYRQYGRRTSKCRRDSGTPGECYMETSFQLSSPIWPFEHNSNATTAIPEGEIVPQLIIHSSCPLNFQNFCERITVQLKHRMFHRQRMFGVSRSDCSLACLALFVRTFRFGSFVPFVRAFRFVRSIPSLVRSSVHSLVCSFLYLLFVSQEVLPIHLLFAPSSIGLISSCLVATSGATVRSKVQKAYFRSN